MSLKDTEVLVRLPSVVRNKIISVTEGFSEGVCN